MNPNAYNIILHSQKLSQSFPSLKKKALQFRKLRDDEIYFKNLFSYSILADFKFLHKKTNFELKYLIYELCVEFKIKMGFSAFKRKRNLIIIYSKLLRKKMNTPYKN